MVMAKRQGREKPAKIEQRTGVRTSGGTNSIPGWPHLHSAGPGGGKRHIKRGAKGPWVSLSVSSLCIFWVGIPSCLEDAFSFIF